MSEESTQTDPTILDFDVVEKQLDVLKPEVVDELARRTQARIDKRAEQNRSENFGAMANGEFRDFVRKNYGFNPDI